MDIIVHVNHTHVSCINNVSRKSKVIKEYKIYHMSRNNVEVTATTSKILFLI